MSCIICGNQLEGDTVTIGNKGLKTLCKFSKLRKDNLFYYSENLQAILHTNCRKIYTKENVKGIYLPIQGNVAPQSTSADRNTLCDFPFKTKCLFCTKDLNKPLSKIQLISQISRDSTQKTIIEALKKISSSTNEAILQRIGNINLVSSQAHYHRKCFLSVIKGTQYLKRGRPECTYVASAMNMLFDYIENNEKSQFSLKELKQHLSDYEPDNRTIKKKLAEKYGQKMIITENHKFGPIFTLKDSVENIFEEEEVWYNEKQDSVENIFEEEVWYNVKNEDEETERIRIVKKAAEIIRKDICLKNYSKDNLSSPNDFFKNAEQDMPRTLGIFLKTLVGQESENEELQ